MTESKSFKVWVETENSVGFTPLDTAYYEVAQEFQSETYKL